VRWLPFLAVAALIVVVLWPWLRGALPRLPASGTRRDELVKDPVCQTYVVMSRAIRRETEAGPAYFCSRECAERFVGGERRA
jgi:YHS domain-containing protein